MSKFVNVRSLLIGAMCITSLFGCATKTLTAFQTDEFVSTSIHSQVFPGSGAATCEAARRALLSQGYIISLAKTDLVKGQKNFQPQDDVHVQVEFHIVCAPNNIGSNSTTVFVNALQDRYSLKKSSSSASVGVSVLGSLSLPFGASDESLVKVASETIQDRRFYQRLFTLIDTYLDAGPGSPASTKDDLPPLEIPSVENTPDLERFAK